RHAVSVADHVTLAPSPGSIRWIRTGFRPTTHRPHGATIHDRSRPINLVISSEPIQQRKVHQIPRPDFLPIAQSSPPRHPRHAAEFLRRHLPREGAAKGKENAGETRTIRDARPSTARSSWWT